MCGCEIDHGPTGQFYAFPDWQCGLCGWVHDDLYCLQCDGLLATSGNRFKHACPVYAELEQEAAHSGEDVELLVDKRVKANRATPPYQSPVGKCECDFSNLPFLPTAALVHPVALERCAECECPRARWLCNRCGKAYAEDWPGSPWHRSDCKAEQQASV